MRNGQGSPVTVGIDASRANRDGRTGVEWYAHDLILALMRIVPKGIRVVLYSDSPLRGRLADLPEGWESRVLEWPPRYLWTQLRLGPEMVVRPPDLLFVPAHVPPLMQPRRTVAVLHDVGFAALPEAYSRFGRAYNELMTRLALRMSRRIVTVSEFSRQELVERYGARPEGVTVTYLACDRERFREDLDPAETERRLAAFGLRRPYFLFVGRLETKKGVDVLLDAFSRFRGVGGRDEWSLALVGKRGLGSERIFGEYPGGPGDGVVELGYVGPDDLPHLYRGAEGLVFASRYEGFGIPVLEAFASGVPVIASRGSSLPEVAGDAALFVEPDDADGLAAAMGRLAEGDDLRRRLVESGQRRVNDFSWEKTAEKTWRLIESALG